MINAFKLESWDNSKDKRRFKIVRTDYYTDVDMPGELYTADECSGECSYRVGGGETKTLSFGPGGIRIVGRGMI